MKTITKARVGVVVVAAILGSLGSAAYAQASPSSATPTLTINPAIFRSDPIPLSQAVARLQSRKALRANTPSASAVDCGDSAVTFRSVANGALVSAEYGWHDADRSGELRARATEVGPWEKFAVCAYGGGWVIGSLNTLDPNATVKFVSTELNWPDGDWHLGMLRARADAIGPWEQYEIVNHGSYVTIRSLANRMYVSTELEPVFSKTDERHGMLRARASAIGLWEQYR